MLNLYLVRHGETLWNVEKRLQGFLDSDLTDLGVYQAKKLGERLLDVDFSKVYASPSGRTQKTAELVSKRTTADIINDSRIKEINFGSIEGRRTAKLPDDVKKQLDIMHEIPSEYDPSAYEGETYEDLFTRTDSFLNDVLKNDNGDVLVVAHGMSLMAMIATIKKLKLNDFWIYGLKPNVSLTKYEYNDDNFKENLFYDISHYE